MEDFDKVLEDGFKEENIGRAKFIEGSTESNEFEEEPASKSVFRQSTGKPVKKTTGNTPTGNVTVSPGTISVGSSINMADSSNTETVIGFGENLLDDVQPETLQEILIILNADGFNHGEIHRLPMNQAQNLKNRGIALFR